MATLTVTIKSRSVSGRIRVYKNVVGINLDVDDGTTILSMTDDSTVLFYTSQWTLEVETRD
jgi:hypothetical protein